MKKLLLVLSWIFTMTMNGQTCVPTNTVSPLLCLDSANNIYIVDSAADVQIFIEDALATKQNVVWAPSDYLYLSPNQANPYPGSFQTTDIYFNGAPSHQVYTYTASYQLPGCPAVTETFTLVTGGFTYSLSCGGTKTLADTDILNIPDSNLSWYSDSAGTMPLPNNTSLVVGTTYYVDLGYAGCSTFFPLNVEYSTPLPAGDTTQEFCTTATWTNAGFPSSQIGGVVADLYVSGDNLSWYSNAAGTIPITSPSTTALVNGTVYYVSQTVNGCESPLLAITAIERQFPCFKNPGFEDISLSTYEFYDEKRTTLNPTSVCGIVSSMVNDPVTLGPLNSNGDDSAAPFSQGYDLKLSAYGILLPTTSTNGFSEYAIRLNDDGSGTASSKISKMQTDFIAGEALVFDFSLVFDNPATHVPADAPFFIVRIIDQNGNLFLERCFSVSNQTNLFLDVSQMNGPGDPDPGPGSLLYSEWSCLKLNTANLQGQPATVQFLISDCGPGGHSGYAYIDNIFVGQFADVSCNDLTCPDPTNITVTSIIGQSVNFTWDVVVNAANGYDWSVYAQGSDPTTATPVATGTVTGNSVSVTGLSPQTNYDFYVSANCGSSGSSDLVGPLVFTTFAMPSNLNVGNSTATSVDVSWTENGTATQWELQYGPLGFDPMASGTNLVDNDGVLSETISGLTPDMDYDIYVRSVYTSGTSAWMGPQTFTTLLSIDQVVFEGFEFYPNPVNEKLFLFAQNNIQQIVLYDLLGKRILKSNPNTLESILDTSQLKPGIYFMEVAIQESTKMYQIIKE